MYRVKAAAGPAGGAKGMAPLNDRLSQVVQRMVNLQANGLTFAAHDAIELAIPTIARNAPLLTSKAKPPTKRHYFCGAAFAREVMKASLVDGPQPVSLSLPAHFIDANEDVSDLLPRTMYHHSDLLSATPLEDMVSPGGAAAPMLMTSFGEKARFPWPRCGQSGLFYTREDVVDNLIQAAIGLQYQSPFWIPETHPQLRKFLQLKPGAQPVVISIASRVAPVEVVKLLPAQLVFEPLKAVKYASLKPKASVSPFHNANVPAGTNVFTGEVCANPYLCGTAAANGKQPQSASQQFCQHAALKEVQLPVNNRGIWLSLSQFVRHGLALRDEFSVVVPPAAAGAEESAKKASAEAVDDALIAHMKRLLEVFTCIETKQLVLYNADQLVVPGRLALKSRQENTEAGDVIEVFH